MTEIEVDRTIEPAGTSLVGSLEASYERLVRAFGEPESGADPDGKVQCEWLLRTPYGVASVYDYKESVPPQQVTQWSIDGRDPRAAKLVERAVSLGS